tara:strand:+ start:1393 stop:1911 length:519 start_codon:yes stop_codon:yes gene_type:complete
MNYEDQFQKRYQDTLAKLAEGVAAGQAPEDVFKMIQTASLDKGDPTFREAQAQALGPKMVGSGVISDVEIENVEKYTPEQRMQMDLGKPLSEITEQERRGWMAMDRENNMAIGSMSDEEIMMYEGSLPSGSYEDMRKRALIKEGQTLGTGAIGELPSSVEGFLGNLRRKIGE